jgi:chemotaxis signal transduction protein
MTAAALKADDQPFVALGLDQDVFAVPAEAVLEILDMRPMTRIPEAPPHLSALEPPPRIGLRWPAHYVRCIGKRGADMIVVLEIERVFPTIETIEAGGPASPARDAVRPLPGHVLPRVESYSGAR